MLLAFSSSVLFPEAFELLDEKVAIEYLWIFFFVMSLAFMPVTKEICKLPSYFSSVLFQKLDINRTGLVTKYALTFRICNDNVDSHLSSKCFFEW